MKYDRRWVSFLLLLLVLLTGFLLGPEWTERWYSRGLYPVIRLVLGWAGALSPLPLIYLLLAVLLGSFLWKCRAWWRWQEARRRKVGSALFTMASWLAFAAASFMWLWGLNYGRVPIESQLGLSVRPLEATELKAELIRVTAELTAARSAIPGVTEAAIGSESLPPQIAGFLVELEEGLLDELGFSTLGQVRARRLFPKGILLRFSSSGVYLPWTGEGHVDAGLHPLEMPFAMAHELAHGYGFGDEGTCNFVAYLTCMRADEPVMRYIGTLEYWRYLASNYRPYEREWYREFYETLPEGVRNDLKAIYEYLERYPDIFPQVRYDVYDTYLKAQGISEGIKNYSRIIMLVHAWERRPDMERTGFWAPTSGGEQ